MLTYIGLCILGCCFGVITGLTPGLHVNTICIIGMSLYRYVGLQPFEYGMFMISVSITHTFLDFIPSIFLGIPDESTSMSVLPTHRLVLDGKAFTAVKLTAIGSLMGLIYSILFLIPALYIIPKVYENIRGFVVYLIIFAQVLMIIREKDWNSRIKALLIFVLAGFFGLTCLDIEYIPETKILFPIFSGLFGLSAIIFTFKSADNKIPQNEYAQITLDKSAANAGLIGSVGGVIVGLLPALSPSQIGTLMSNLYGGKIKNFLIAVSAINTSDAIYSLVALQTIRNGRSGVSVMLSQILEMEINILAIYCGAYCLVASMAYHIHIAIGKIALKKYNKVNYKKLSLLIVFSLLIMIYIICDLTGLYIVFIATLIGTLPMQSNVSRTHLMGVLILPTIIFFLK